MLLAGWSAVALITTVLATGPTPVRAVGLILSLGYAVGCAYFVAQRRRAIASIDAGIPPPGDGRSAVPQRRFRRSGHC